MHDAQHLPLTPMNNLNRLTYWIRTHARESIIAGVAIVLCAIVIIVAVSNSKNNISVSGQPQASSTTATSSTGSAASGTAQNASSTNSQPVAVGTPSTPTVTYPTCTLNLRFGATSGNPAGTGSVNYNLVASILGKTTCQSASISVYYNDGESYVSSNPPATSKGYYWKLGDLAPGQAVTISLATNRSQTLAVGDDTTQACLSANNGNDACANASAGGAVAGTTGGAPIAAAGTGSSATNNGSGESVPNIPTPNLTAFPEISGHEIGIWQWSSLVGMSQATMQQIVDNAAANHFTVIYQTIDAYLDIDELPDGTQKQQQLAAYESQVNEFLTLASAKGIAVDAEAGWRDWAEAGNTWEPSDIMSFVASYNAAHPNGAKFRGVQYDIEPYLLPQYGTDQTGILEDYVALVGQLATDSKSNGLPLTIIIPDFYDAGGKTPEITVAGTTNYTYNFILQALTGIPGARIIVMAYVNTASGAGGSVALSQNEVHDADGTNVKVIIAQETGPVTPAYVTFAGESLDDLFSQVGGIDTAYSSDKSFAGIAIDYYDTYLQLQ